MLQKLNGYQLSRIWFDWCFENPELINPNHSALYFFCIEHCNRLGWKDKFGLPTTMAKEAIGIKSYNTYINTLNDLIKFGFIKLIEKSKNQYSANIIGLSNSNKALNKALDKALIKHLTKQVESTGESNSSVDKQLTNNNKQITIEQFDLFWKLYPKKVDKSKAQKIFSSLTIDEIKKIFETVEAFSKYKPFENYSHPNPTTYLNGKRWQDELINTTSKIVNSIPTQKAYNGFPK